MRAAVDELLEQGYVRARVESITRRAGVGYGTFYRYFASKVDLIRELAERVYGELGERVAQDPDSSRPVAERAFNNILAYFRAVERNRRELLVLEDAIGAEPAVAARVQELQDWRARRYAEKIATPVYHPIDDPEVLARSTAAVAQELARQWLRSAHSGDLDARSAELEQVARVATIMTLALVDPEALGVDAQSIHKIMIELRPDPELA